MGLSKEDYQNQLPQLLPRGRAWRGKTLLTALKAGAEEFFRIDRRADDLLNEADPRTAFEMLEDWERVTGLPDECAGAGATIDLRRNQVVEVLTRNSNPTVAFYKSVAAFLGYVVDIEEYTQDGAYGPFRAGDRVGKRCYGFKWMFTFTVIAPANTLRVFRAGTHNAGERLAEFGDDVLECVINKLKPAHTLALFSYV